RTDLALMVGLGVAAVAGTGVGWTTHRLLRGQPRPLPTAGATGLESSTPHEVELAAADLAALADADPARRQELVNLLYARVSRPWSGEPDERALRLAILVSHLDQFGLVPAHQGLFPALRVGPVLQAEQDEIEPVGRQARRLLAP